jgi:hypothetical protein
MAPLILSQPQSVTAKTGQTIDLQIRVAAVPEPSYQWFKNGMPVRGATSSSLIIQDASASDGGNYAVTVKNDAMRVASDRIVLSVLR